MNFSYCPQLDRLGNELIEAYRLLDDQDDLWPVRPGAPDQISAIHHRMAEHRRFCPLCQRIASLSANRGPANTGTDKPDTPRPH